MTLERDRFLCDRVLIDLDIEHGFGLRDSQPPENTAFPTQVHGIDVFDATSRSARDRPRADVVVSTTPGLPIGIVTADCVPILIAAEDGRAVAAIHAGWRGLATGVIEAGVRVVKAAARGASLVAAVGPAARGCCYEVDEPVRVALAETYSDALREALEPGRPGHFQLDLPRLATRVLAGSGVDCHQIGTQHRLCTICNPDLFESYRRDGVASGRMSHFIASSG
jgi:YfiH family protein